jgi:hypothetical protein
MFTVTDEESDPIKVLGRFKTEAEASAWIGNQPDKEKIHRGGYGLNPPPDDDLEIPTFLRRY